MLWAPVALALASAGCGDRASPKEKVATGPLRSSVSVLGSDVTITRKQVEVRLRLRQPADVDPPIARSARLVLPKGISWHGGDAPSCSLDTLKASGPGGCPAGAMLGTGEAIGIADTARTVGQMAAVDGGPQAVYLATTVHNPAYVKTVVRGAISTTDDGSLQIDLTFPPDLQTIAGVPVGLQRLRLSVARGPALRVSSCPASGHWSYRSSVDFVDGTQAHHAGRAPCKDQ
jgi:hypothetical protein